MHDRARCFKNNALPKNGENRPSLRIFKCIGKFSFFLNSLFFFSVWYIMKVYDTVIVVCLNKFHIWENWYVRYGPYSWPIRLQDFSINRWTVKMAISDEGINGINCFFGVSVHQFSQE